MPDYKVVDAAQLDADITSVADAIRAKGGTTEPLAWPTEFASAVEGIQSGGSDEGWIGDGNTHIWIHLEDGRTSPMLGCCPNGTVTVDWGDGTVKDTLTGTDTSTVKWTPTHNYAGPGNYVITLIVDGEVGFRGGNGGTCVFRYSSGKDNRNTAYQNAVKKVELSGSVTAIGGSAFGDCYSLSSVLIPDSVTAIGGSAFATCYSLSSVLIPDSVTAIGGSAFATCYSLSSVLIPDSVTSIGDAAFYACHALSSVLIQGSVTSIGDAAFYFCYGVRYYDFTACTSVPTLSSTSAFSGIAPDCEIRVPAALYDEWVAATNWSTYADHIVGVGLPSEYQPVEYIESTGTQYINTGYTVKSNYLEIKSRIFTSVKRAEMAVFGSDKTLEAGFSTTLNRMFAYSTGASSLGGIFSNIYDNIIDFNVKLYPSGRTLAVDAEEVNDDKNHNLTGEVIRLFGYYGTAYKFKGRIYSFQIFDNNALVLDFVPCYRKSDHVIGMYDLVGKTFLINQGTGDFIAGADV